MADATPLELVYEGEEVDDGTIPVDYLIQSLIGFSGAYDKIAGRTQPDTAYRIRVLGLRRDSTHILMDVIEWVLVNPAAAEVIETGIIAVAAGAYKITKDIGKYISAKKKLKGASPTKEQIIVEGENIFLLLSSGEKLPLTKEQAQILLQGLLDSDLNKLSMPLDDPKVDRFELRHKNEVVAEINKAERPFFFKAEAAVTSTRDDVWMEGVLNSLTKDRARGTFHSSSGKHIPYHFAGTDEQQLLQAFAHNGLVRALSKVSLDADLNPTSMEIKSLQLSQRGLFN